MDFYKLFMNDFFILIISGEAETTLKCKRKRNANAFLFYSDSVWISKKFSVLPNGDFFPGGVKSIPAAFA